MKKGFTLIELLMAITLVGMVVLSFGALQGIAHSFFFQSAGMANAQGESSYGMLHIKRKLTRANRVILWSPTRIAFRYDHRSIAGGTATPSDPTDDEWDYYRLDAANGLLLYRNNFSGVIANGFDPADLSDVFDANDGVNVGVNGGPNENGEEVVARGVTALAFTQVSPYEVDVDMTVLQQVGRQARSTRVRGSITPRGVGSP